VEKFREAHDAENHHAITMQSIADAHNWKTVSNCRSEKPTGVHAALDDIGRMFQRINIASP
jgi:hypothetical protein